MLNTDGTSVFLIDSLVPILHRNAMECTTVVQSGKLRDLCHPSSGGFPFTVASGICPGTSFP